MSMNIYSIPIYGVIGEDTKHTDVLLHLNNAQKYDAIKLLIDSPGGYIDEAEKMCKSIVSLGKPIFTTNTGDVCSAAVDLFLLASKPNRTFNPSRGQFLIHNPWGQFEGEGEENSGHPVSRARRHRLYCAGAAGSAGAGLRTTSGKRQGGRAGAAGRGPPG